MLRSAEYSEDFLKDVGTTKFRHPDTGRQVEFGSLPSERKTEIHKSWKKRHEQEHEDGKTVEVQGDSYPDDGPHTELRAKYLAPPNPRYPESKQTWEAVRDWTKKHKPFEDDLESVLMAVDNGHFSPPRTEADITEIAHKLRVPMKTASYSEEFLKSVVDRKFRNPETGNDVVFDSLPHGEQQKIFKQWSSQKSEKPVKEKAKKKPTFEAARKEVFSALKGDGWTLKDGLKTPQATKRVGDETVILHFKPQALWVETKSKRTSSAPRSMWVDIRDIAHDSEKWTKEELPKLVKHFTDVKMASNSRTADKWQGMPKGWTDESRKKFWNSLTSGAPKHKVSLCIKKMEGKVTNAGAFCASLADRVVGKEWRSESRKKADLLNTLQRIASELGQPLRTRRDYGEGDRFDVFAKRADTEWIDQREMAELCPPCAQRMRRAGLSKVRVSVVRRLIASGTIARR